MGWCLCAVLGVLAVSTSSASTWSTKCKWYGQCECMYVIWLQLYSDSVYSKGLRCVALFPLTAAVSPTPLTSTQSAQTKTSSDSLVSPLHNRPNQVRDKVKFFPTLPYQSTV